jgi:broad specificity phosphatase PhoE
VRHGESQRNEAKKGNIYFADDEQRAHIKGIPDHEIALTEKGEKQAFATGQYLREHFDEFDYAYHSGYKRTKDTLNGIIQGTNGIITRWSGEEDKPLIRENHFIRERDPGHAYDMTTEEAEAAFPWLHEYWQTFGGYMARPPGGESLADVEARVYIFLNMLFRDRCGDNILAVTHGGTLRAFRVLLDRWTYSEAARWPDGDRPENCAITHYEFEQEKGKLVLVESNFVKHLDELN